ncbi:MAG: hypothetical protein U0Z44_21875 [Kouleothrix sp.]
MGLELFERSGLPRWARVRQRLHAAAIDDVAAAVAAELAARDRRSDQAGRARWR